MRSSVPEIAARLTLNGSQFSTEMARHFGAVEAAAANAGARAKASFESSFNEIEALAKRALSTPRNTSGALDLGVGQARQAAAAADAQAQALREVAAAAEMAAKKTGDQSENTRLYVQAARAAAMEAELAAKGARDHAAALDLLQVELNQTKSSTDLVIQGNRLLNQSYDVVARGAGRSGMISVQASQQVQDFFIQVQGGQRITVAAAQQLSQLAFVMQGAGGTAGKAAAIMSGPWGSAILLGTMLLGNFLPKLWEQGDALEKATGEAEEHGRQAAITRQAQELWKQTTEGLIEASFELEKQTKRLNESSAAAAQRAIDEANATLQNTIKKRESTKATLELLRAELLLATAREKVAAMDPRFSQQAAKEGLGPRIVAAQKEINDLDAAIARDRAAKAELTISKVRSDVAAATDKAAAANERYASTIDRMEQAYRKSSKSEADLRKLREGSEAAARRLAADTAAARHENRGSSASNMRNSLPSVTRQEVAEILGTTITSGLRSPARNKSVGGSANSYHLSGMAIDIPLTVNGKPLTKEVIRESLTEAGIQIKELKGPGDKGHDDHFHIAFNKRRLGPDQVAAKRDISLKNEAEQLERMVKITQDQLALEEESFRLLGMRLRGRDDEAALAQHIASIQRETAEQRAQLTADEARVTDGLKDQLSTLESQAVQYAAMLRAHGDRETLSAGEIAAEEKIWAAMAAQLETAKGLTKSSADRLLIDEALAKANARIAQGEQIGDREGKKADNAAAQAQKEWEELQRQQKEDAEQQLSDLADFYEQAFETGGKSIWDDFKSQGKRVLAMLAAQWTMALLSGQKASLPNILQQLGATTQGDGFNLGSLFVGSGGGRAPGQSIADLAPPSLERLYGGSISEAGAVGGAGAAGGFLGTGMGAMPVIGGAFAAVDAIANLFGVKGGLLGGIGSLLGLKKTKKGSASLGFDQYGQLGVASTSGNSDKRIDAASGAIGNLVDMLENIADQLGGELTGRPSVSIGVRKDKWVVDTLGRGNTKGSGTQKFADEEAAIRAALADALRDGVISGISDASKRILASGQQLERAIEKAILIEDIPRRLQAMLDPVGFAISEVNKKWEATVAALKEGAATAQQMAEAQQLYNLELEEAKTQTRSLSADLKDFRDSLNFGSSSPYSLRDQEKMAKASLQPFLDKIAAGQSIDQAKYIETSQQYLDIERQLYGSTAQFFKAMDMVQASTGKAIMTIDNAVPVRTVSDPFNEVTANNTGASADLLAQHTAILNQQTALLGSMASSLSGGYTAKTAWIDENRGFA